jgi:co-chaperonin GroES (HSP10)|nr:MAG TPA: chaperonin [Herelleviridae sp.]
MSKVELNLLSVEKAKWLNEKLKGVGTPTGSRVLIVSPVVTADTKTKGGLYIPQDHDKDTVPRKGVVIQVGPITNEQREDYPGLQVGAVVTYGLYAGKELDILDLPDQVTTILSLNEILYIETNE